MKLLDILRSSTEFLQKSGVDEPSIHAEILVLHRVGVDRITAYRDNPEIDRKTFLEISALLERRALGEPVQYIVGEVNFLDLRINVGRGVLVPRPETELLALEAIKEVQSSADAARHTPDFLLSVLDLCTGSGCVSLAIARKFPDAAIYGTDISEIAIAYAKQNAGVNGIKNVMFLNGPLFKPVGGALLFDIIVSNPPYIRTADISDLQREIRDWEPLIALDGGSDGLDFYRNIFSGAGHYLKKGGRILLEIGYDQAPHVRKIARDNGFGKTAVVKDLAGIDRILKAGE